MSALFKRPVHIVLGTVCDRDGNEVCEPFNTSHAEFIATAINAYSPGREAAVQGLVEALRDIAAFSDTGASEILESTGSWAAFDEPGAAEKARAALSSYEASK